MQTPFTLARAHETLRSEIAEAIFTDPTKLVSTPGFAKQAQSAVDVVLDDFSGSQGEGSLTALLWIVGQAAKGKDVGCAAALWVSILAERHAKFHADDMVHRQLEAA